MCSELQCEKKASLLAAIVHTEYESKFYVLIFKKHPFMN